MKLSRDQLFIIQTVVQRRIYNKHESEFKAAKAKVNAAYELEEAAHGKAIYEKHKATIKKIDALRKRREDLHKETQAVSEEIVETCKPLLGHFKSSGVAGEVDFTRPIFKMSDALVKQRLELAQMEDRLHRIPSMESDEIIMKLSLADAPQAHAILAEYGINLNGGKANDHD